MEVYEVKYEFYSVIGNAFSMTCTVKADNPEKAKSAGYNSAFKTRPSKGKIKFMYVRRLPSYL